MQEPSNVFSGDVLVSKRGVDVILQKLKVTCKETLFFPYSLEDVSLLKQVLHVPLVEPLSFPACDTPNQTTSQSIHIISQSRYKRFVGKLIYLTITRPHLYFALKVVCRLLVFIIEVLYHSHYHVFINNNIISWRSKNIMCLLNLVSKLNKG